MNNSAINPLIQSVVYNNYTTDYHLVLYESCFWSATIFKSDRQEYKITECPICFNDNSISLIPLIKDEVYESSVIDPKVD
jgi:hypothetical protein